MKNNSTTLPSNRYLNILFLFTLLILFTLIPLNITLANITQIESDSLEYPKERFSVNLGGFVAGLKSDIIIGSKQIGLGLALNLEEALGLESSIWVLRGEAEYNFGKRRRSLARFGYFGYFRVARKVLESELEIGDEIYPIGTELNSQFNFQIFKGTYDYAFYLDKRVRLCVSLGLFIMPINFSTSAMDQAEVNADFIAPLPVLGISTDFAITPKIHLKQSIEFFYLEFSNFKGVLTDLNVRVEYNPWRHFGFGFGLDTYDLNITVAKDSNIDLDFVGSVETSFTGLLFYGKYYF